HFGEVLSKTIQRIITLRDIETMLRNLFKNLVRKNKQDILWDYSGRHRLTMCSRIGAYAPRSRKLSRRSRCRDTSAPPNRIAAAHFVRLRWWDVVNTETLCETPVKPQFSLRTIRGVYI